MSTTWFDEVPYEGMQVRLEVERVVYEGRSRFQSFAFLETTHFGRVLTLDGVFQTSERDEAAYHEMLVHVPMFAHGSASRVLIIGGGDGGTLREVLRHPVQHVTMVEIDGAVVDGCRRYLPSLSDGAFDDPRLDLHIDDGVAYVRGCESHYDVIIVDSTDPYPQGPGTVLFTEAFYRDCARVLDHGGILSNQQGMVQLAPRSLITARERLQSAFSNVEFYLASIPLYVGGYMGFGFASMAPGPRGIALDILESRYATAGIETRFYTPALHRAAFALPANLCS